MKVKLLWYRDTDPFNWGDTEAKGIKNIKESLPNAKIMGTWKDGYVDVECFSILEVKTLEELIEAIENETSLYDVEVFGVFDMKGKQLFTEQEMYERGDKHLENLNMIEYCPKCREILEHITLNKENVYGCSNCKKEMPRGQAITFQERLKEL